MPDRLPYILALLGVPIIALTLWAWGQPLICTCGYVQFWVGSIFDSGNSQHIADWYTLSHFLHGVLVVLVGRLVMRDAPFNMLLLTAVITGVGWEIIEHTNFVLDAFRATTVNQGYTGDSVLNAVADYLWMLAGFGIAWTLHTRMVIAIIVALEVTAAFVARDSLVLSTLMLVAPVEAVGDWQQQINPNHVDD